MDPIGSMQQIDRMNAAAAEGDIDRLYALIEEDPHVLENIEAKPFVETPLHVAASSGHVQFATEIMNLKPSFALKRNQQGWCPIHLALQNGGMTMVHRFIEINKDLVRVKGREGLTPLHLILTLDPRIIEYNHHLHKFLKACPDSIKDEYNHHLHKFLKACPDSIKDVTVRSETALHIAVKYRRLEALEFLVRWLKRKTRAENLEETILNWKDDAGNTILHIAASNKDTQAIAFLIKSTVDLQAVNLKGKTALDIAGSEDIKMKLVRAGARPTTWILLILSIIELAKRSIRTLEYMPMEESNAYLVVATLVATATYQAALSPPGGLYQADAGTNNTLSHAAFNSSINWKPTTGNEGNSIMSNMDFISFSSTNMFSFMASTFAIFGLLPRNAVWPLLFVPTFLLQLSYFFSMLVISPTRLTSIVVVCIFMVVDGIFSLVGPTLLP